MGTVGRVFLVVTLGASVTSCAAPTRLVQDFFAPKPTVAAKTGCRPVTTKPIVHVVRTGETLSEIAQCYRTSWFLIASRNNLRDPNVIQRGQKLTIPPRTYRTATRGSSRSSGQKSAVPAKAPSRAKSGIAWIWPTQGKVIRKFSPSASGKQGIAIAGRQGQKILASAPGKIVFSGQGLVGYGRLIIVQHQKDFLTAYAHNDRLLVKEGQRVARGEAIAYMGQTAAKSPRLYFEMRYKGRPVDPLQYLP